MKENIVLHCDAGVKIVFTPASGGMPAEIVVDGKNIIASPWQLSMHLAGVGKIFPDGRSCPAARYEQNDAQVVEFADLHWCDGAGNEVPDFHLGLRYELFPDGVTFCTAILHVESCHPPVCSDFNLIMPLDFSSYPDCRFSTVPRLTSANAADIQSTVLRRFIPAGEEIRYSGNYPAWYGFNLFDAAGTNMYGEVFVESGASLSGKMADCGASLVWQGKNPTLSWIFQNRELRREHRPLQWRNRWGWHFAPPAKKLTLPPQHCYQFIDNYRHYPSDDELETIRRSGCTMLVIHSNWRRDAANGAMPYDPERLQKIAAFTRKNQIRLLLYVRGNEREIVDNAGAWFSRILDPERDGIYMDYGGPIGRITPPNEYAPGGTVEIYNHYLTLKQLRRNIGDKAVLISHTGAYFSSVGISFADAYISGEGERGKLLSGRMEYDYFTMSAAAPGSLWSAAFPEYTTREIIPFIAAAGQFPHSALGMQFASSSLLHPPEPGINDSVFRPLWRIWHLMAHQRDVTVFNDFNCRGIFSGASGVGHYLMISADKRCALLVLSDFGGRGSVDVNWRQTGFSLVGKRCFHLEPDENSPGAGVEVTPGGYEARFAKFPAEAYWFSPDEMPVDFALPYPECGVSGRAFLQDVEKQRQLRKVPATAKAALRLYLDDRLCTALEDSMVVDLFDETVQLCEVVDGKIVPLGVITPEEFLPECERFDTPRLMSGCTTAPVDLAALLGRGTHQLAVRSLYNGEPFYSFVNVLLDTDDGKRELEFRNQIEVDRSVITFEITIK